MRALVTILLLFSFAGCNSQNRAPKVFCDKTLFELGVVESGKETKVECVIRNIGTGSLVISHINSSCKCARTSISKSEIPSDHQSVIDIVVDSSRNGPGEAKLSIFTNDPKTPVLPIVVKFTVGKRIAFGRVRLDALTLSTGEKGTQEFPIFSDDLQLEIDTAIKSQTPEIVSKVSIVDGIGRIEFDSEAIPSGFYEGLLVIQTKSGEELSSIPWVVKVVGAMAVVPQEIFASKKNRSESIIQMVVEGAQLAPLTIERRDGTELKFEVLKKEKEMVLLELKLPEDFVDESFVVRSGSLHSTIQVTWTD